MHRAPTRQGAEAVRAAVRRWAGLVRKTVADECAELPLDPPTQTQTPRAAALISDEEAMSAGGAAALDDAHEAEEIEEIPHPDDAREGGEEDEEEEPFTDEEVAQLKAEVTAMITESFAEDEARSQLAELEAELKDKDLQERGQFLVMVVEYLEDRQGADDAEGAADADLEVPPYEGPEALSRLRAEVFEMCIEEDVPRLEQELDEKSPEEQWRLLFEVRDYLEGDPEEQAAFDEWQPSARELEAEWRQMLRHIPAEDYDEVTTEWKGAGEVEKKKMVWDVRKYVAEQEAADAAEAEERAAAEPRRPNRRDDDVGKSEVRRRAGRRGGDYEYDRNLEYDFPQNDDTDGGEWGEAYSKEAKRGRRGARGMLAVGAVVGLGCTLLLLLSATVLADDDEPVFHSALRLLRLS